MNDITTEFTPNYDGSVLEVKRTQDVEPYLEANKRDRLETPSWQPFSGRDMYRVASIPLIVVEQWIKEGINLFDSSDKPKVMARLNSPEYSYLRTMTGKI